MHDDAGGISNTSETVSRLTDSELDRIAFGSVKALNEAERVQRNTSFNGSVQFAFPAGQNQSADAQDRARLSQFNVFKGQVQGGQDLSSDILTELKNLKTELKNNKEETNKLYTILNNVTRGGYAMQTQAAT